jgi:DNA adenine methylase Dam
MNYIKTPLNYTGSKFRFLDQILPMFNYDKNTFIDLFTGGGSIYTNVLDKYNKIIINDIIKDLIGIHKELLKSDNIINNVKNLVVSKDDKDGYMSLRDNYNNDPSPDKLWALMLCCTNNMLRFNKKFKFNQTFGKRSYNMSTEKKVQEFINHIRKYKDKLVYRNEYFSNIKYNNSMVYIDPPYSNTEAGYNSYWNKDDDILLYEYIKDIEKDFSFLVSGIMGDHDNKKSRLVEMLLSDGYNYKIINGDYNHVSRNKRKKQGNEIIIYNY